ncbi:MAG: ArnT family glycosyltransferase [Bacteriovoracaceae bacterium]
MKNRNIFILFLLSFIARIIYSLYVHQPKDLIQSDMEIYFRISSLIQRGIWDENHFFQPVGFPLILLKLRDYFENWSLALSILQATASTLTLYFIWKTTSFTWGEKNAKFILIVGALHIPWILFTGLSLPETFYTFFLSILLWSGCQILYQHKTLLNSIIWGITFSIAFWIKGQHIFLLPLLIFSLWLKDKNRFLNKTIIPVCLIFISSLSLHGHLTYKTIGKAQFSPTAGGLNFVEGKCPSKRNSDTKNMTFYSPLYYHLRMDTYKKWNHPFSDSTYFMQEGLKCIKENPMVLVQSLENIPYLFFGNPIWPLDWNKHANSIRLYELLFTLICLPGIFIYFFTMFKNFNSNEFILWILPMLSIFLTVYIFKSEARYRVPFDVFFIPVAIRGIDLLMNHFQFRPIKRAHLQLIKS